MKKFVVYYRLLLSFFTVFLLAISYKITITSFINNDLETSLYYLAVIILGTSATLPFLKEMSRILKFIFIKSLNLEQTQSLKLGRILLYAPLFYSFMQAITFQSSVGLVEYVVMTFAFINVYLLLAFLSMNKELTSILTFTKENIKK